MVPGEQLPRWSLNCFWRSDGEPIWRDEALIADETQAGDATEATAREFLRGVAERLGLDPSFVFPGYEDLYYYMWRERRLPANVDPFDSRLEDPLERERLMRIFTQGLTEVAGYALPVVRDVAHGTLRSGRWFLRADRCYWFPEIRPWACGCPSIRSLGLAKVITRLPSRLIQRSSFSPWQATRKFTFRSTRHEP